MNAFPSANKMEILCVQMQKPQQRDIRCNLFIFPRGSNCKQNHISGSFFLHFIYFFFFCFTTEKKKKTFVAHDVLAPSQKACSRSDVTYSWPASF